MKGIIEEIEFHFTNFLNLILPFLKKIKYITFLSIALQFLSIIFVLLLPNFGSQTYVSEKNLQCTVSPFIDSVFSERSINYSNNFNNLFPNRGIGTNESINSANWIKEQLDLIGLETQLHYFKSSYNRIGVNVIGIIKARRSLGTECFVLTTSFDQWHSKGSVGFLIGLSEYLKNTTWQARDLIIVFTSEGGEINGGTNMDISGISVWLNDYFSKNHQLIGWVNDLIFLRAGKIFGTISFDRIGMLMNNNNNNNNNKNQNNNSNLNNITSNLPNMEKIIVYPEGLSGGLSNLDLINIITTTSFLNDIPAGINTHMFDEDVEGSIYGLLVFMWNSAISLPRSNHAIFTKYGINSVGVSTDYSHNVWDIDYLNTPLHKIHSSFNSQYQQQQQQQQQQQLFDFQLNNNTILNLGKIIETVIRHLHNADEQLHQSYHWYVMAGGVFFIDIGQALLPTIILTVSMGLQFLSIILSIDQLVIRIILAIPEFFSILIFCFFLYLLPNLLIHLKFLPSKELKPADILNLNFYSFEFDIIKISLIYLIFCLIVYLIVLLPISKYIKNIVITKYPKLKNDWYGLQSLLLLYYSLISLMCMMLNNQFACLFMIFSLPIIQFTGFLLECSLKSKIIKLAWLGICLFSHPLFILFEWWSIWSVGFKNLFIGILIASNNWGFLFYPIFTLCLLPIYLNIFKLLFIINYKENSNKLKKY